MKTIEMKRAFVMRFQFRGTPEENWFKGASRCSRKVERSWRGKARFHRGVAANPKQKRARTQETRGRSR